MDRQAHQNKLIRSTIDAMSAIRDSQDFSHWTRNELQKVLPHESSICGVGKWDGAGLKMSKSVACNFPRSYLGELHIPEDRLQLFFSRAGSDSRSRSFVNLKTKIGKLPCRINFNDYASRNLMLHGVLDGEGKRVTLFSFFRIPVKLTSRHSRLLQLLAPHLHKALGRALAPSHDMSAKNKPLLSERAREILGFVARGRTDLEIAHSLLLSQKTVSHHLANILYKLKPSSRAHAVAIGIAHQLISVEEKVLDMGTLPMAGREILDSMQKSFYFLTQISGSPK